MRKLRNLLGMLLLTAAVVFPMNAQAAAKNVCQTLQPSKKYSYNLDKKGKEETVKVNFSVKKKYTNTFGQQVYDVKASVSIDGKSVYSNVYKGENAQSYDSNGQRPIKVIVADTDKGDKQMELFIIEGYLPRQQIYSETGSGLVTCDDDWTSDMSHIYYYQYANGSAKRMQDLTPLFRKKFKNIYSLHGMGIKSFLTTDGKKGLSAKLCLSVPNYDYVHVESKLTLKKGKFVVQSQKSYPVVDGNEDPFRLEKNIAVYTKPGGNKKAFTVKKKERITVCGLYSPNDRKIYLKVKNKKGQVGYIIPEKTPTYLDGTNHT